MMEKTSFNLSLLHPEQQFFEFLGLIIRCKARGVSPFFSGVFPSLEKEKKKEVQKLFLFFPPLHH